MTHKTIVCSCGKTLSTCRCPAPNKPKVVSDKPCIHDAPGPKPAVLVTPAHDAAVAAKALREAVERSAIVIPDVLGYKVRAVAVEDLLDEADRIEREGGSDE